MKVLVCDKISDKGVDLLKEYGFDVDVKIGMTPDELNAVVGDYEVAVVRSATKFRKEALDAGTNLKLIVRGGVGLDNIDLEYAKSKGINVRNTPSAATESVAELVIGLFITLSRKIVLADSSMKAGKWEKKLFSGTELYQKTLGIIGLGRIGLAVANIAKSAFQMKVIGYDPYANKEAVEKQGVSVMNLDEVLAQSDFLTLHLPLTPETKHLIDTEQVQKMKKGIIVVDAARGGVVSEDAVMKGIDDEIIAFASLDVYEKEPLSPDSPLLKYDKILLTPHIGSSTKEGQARVSIEVANVIKEELS